MRRPYAGRVDTDAFIAVHQGSWDRLAELVRIRRPDADQIDELIALYQRTATHLSTVRSTMPDPVLTAQLSLLLSRARAKIVGTRTTTLSRLRTVVLDEFPAAVWSARGSILVSVGILLGSVLLTTLVLTLDDSLRASLVPEADQRRIASGQFVAYYFQGEASGFAAKVSTNNAWITFQAVVFGVTGVWPVWMLLSNGFNIGAMSSVMVSHGQTGTLLTYLLPHGLLELTCVAVGAGAGLRVFWAWLRPGPLPRLWSLARSARALVTVAIGLVPILVVSGLLEAFVTPSALPAPVRISIGVLVWAAIVAAVLVRGRRAARRGITGDLAEEIVGDSVAVAA